MPIPDAPSTPNVVVTNPPPPPNVRSSLPFGVRRSTTNRSIIASGSNPRPATRIFSFGSTATAEAMSASPKRSKKNRPSPPPNVRSSLPFAVSRSTAMFSAASNPASPATTTLSPCIATAFPSDPPGNARENLPERWNV